MSTVTVTPVNRFVLIRNLLIATLLALVPVMALSATPAYAADSDTIFSQVNSNRAANGLGALKLNSSMSSVAQAWAQQMAANGVMSHNASNCAQVPAGWTRCGENVAYGYPDGSATMTAWMNSPGHKANILGDYTDIGVGWFVDGNGVSWSVQTFGKYAQPATVAPAPAPTPVQPAPAPVVAPAPQPAPVTTAPAPNTPVPSKPAPPSTGGGSAPYVGSDGGGSDPSAPDQPASDPVTPVNEPPADKDPNGATAVDGDEPVSSDDVDPQIMQSDSGGKSLASEESSAQPNVALLVGLGVGGAAVVCALFVFLSWKFPAAFPFLKR